MRRHGSIVLFVLFLFALVLVQGQGDRTLTQGKCTLSRVFTFSTLLTYLGTFKDIATQQAPEPKGRSFLPNLYANTATVTQTTKTYIHEKYSWLKSYGYTIVKSLTELVNTVPK